MKTRPSEFPLPNSIVPRITDFGLAKRVTGDSGLTATGQILGTPSYMPPEQASGKLHQISPASDIYALGAVLYTLLTGRPPFQAATPLDTVLQVLDQEPVSLRSLNRGIPRDLETIALKCLEKDRSRRYATAQDLADELGPLPCGRADPCPAGESPRASLAVVQEESDCCGPVGQRGDRLAGGGGGLDDACDRGHGGEGPGRPEGRRGARECYLGTEREKQGGRGSYVGVGVSRAREPRAETRGATASCERNRCCTPPRLNRPSASGRLGVRQRPGSI